MALLDSKIVARFHLDPAEVAVSKSSCGREGVEEREASSTVTNVCKTCNFYIIGFPVRWDISTMTESWEVVAYAPL